MQDLAMSRAVTAAAPARAAGGAGAPGREPCPEALAHPRLPLLPDQRRARRSAPWHSHADVPRQRSSVPDMAGSPAPMSRHTATQQQGKALN